jgi:ketosteroid isomerase-like protein
MRDPEIGRRQDGEDSAALRVAMAYFRAWTSKDLNQAMTFIADDIVCDAPAGRIDGAEAYRAFMARSCRL